MINQVETLRQQGLNHNPQSNVNSVHITSQGFSFCSGKGVHQNSDYTIISRESILQLIDNPQNVPKLQAQWLLASSLTSRIKAEQEANGQFGMLWADIDSNPLGVDGLYRVMLKVGCEFYIYTSFSAKQDNQKARVLIPIDKPLSFEDWRVYQEILLDKLAALGIDADKCSLNPSQILFLPNRGEFYRSAINEGDLFDPINQWLIEYQAKQAAKIQTEVKASITKRATPTLFNPDYPINAFNATYHVAEVLRRAGYAQCGSHFRHPNSQSGSFSASVQNGRVHSLSTSDALYTGGDGAHDAFSAYTILFHGGNTSNSLRAACDRLLIINGEPWNQYKQRIWREQQAVLKEVLA